MNYISEIEFKERYGRDYLYWLPDDKKEHYRKLDYGYFHVWGHGKNINIDDFIDMGSWHTVPLWIDPYSKIEYHKYRREINGKKSPYKILFSGKSYKSCEEYLAQFKTKSDIKALCKYYNKLQFGFIYVTKCQANKWFKAINHNNKHIKHKSDNPRAITLSLRFDIFQRDNYKCQICGRSADDGAILELDHKTPVAKGGDNSWDNLWTLCYDCNRGKRDKYV